MFSFHSIPQYVPSKVCLACDGCCRFKDEHSSWRPKVARDEISLASKILSKEVVDASGYLKTQESQGICHCTFFNLSDHSCRIYMDRPFECRLYPFILRRDKGGVVIAVHLNCPHVQEYRGSPQFEQFVKDLKIYFKSQDVLEFIRRNPLLAGDYKEYSGELENLFQVDLKS